MILTLNGITIALPRNDTRAQALLRAGYKEVVPPAVEEQTPETESAPKPARARETAKSEE